jgi:hypothetical protein
MTPRRGDGQSLRAVRMTPSATTAATASQRLGSEYGPDSVNR